MAVDQQESPLDDVEAPLLDTGTPANGRSAPRQQEAHSEHSEQHEQLGCSVFGGVSNLVVTAVGAGMLALPKAFATVGIACGLGLFVLACFLTYFSTTIIVRFAAQVKKRSYGDLIRAEFGATGATILQLAIVIHVGGVMCVYLIIIADMLVGSAPGYGGVLPTMLGRHDGPWFLSRPLVVAVLLLAVVAPMLAHRTLTAVARFSRFSIYLVSAIAITICSLAAVALSRGQAAPDVHVVPVLSEMGDGTPLGITTALLTVVSAACLAFSCHFNILPIQHSLKDPTCGCMRAVIRHSIAICAAFYAAVAISGYTLFGSATDGDVLKNLNIHFVSGLVAPALASVLIYGVVLFYTFNLLVNFVLKVWAVRENVSELVLGKSATYLPNGGFYQLTAALVAVAYGLSVVVPSVWFLVSLVGSTACATFSYIFPGLLVLRREAGLVRRGAAGGMVCLGACMGSIAVYNTLSGHGGL